MEGLPAPGAQVGWMGYTADYEYQEQLEWFDRELAKDPYVLGAAVFNFGSLAPWESYEAAGLVGLADYIRQSNEATGGLPGQPGGNSEGGEMDDATRNRLWSDYMGFPAFQRFRADHPELGEALEEGERDYARYRVKFYAGGIIYAVRGEWDNIHIATTKEELRYLPLG